MYSQFHNSDFSNEDFNIVQYGQRDCRPDFCVYHENCPNFLLHYVYSGKGLFHAEGKDYIVEANQAFIAYPDQEIWYVSDSKDPFSYRWIEFYGNKAVDFLQRASLTPSSPIYTAGEPYKTAKILKNITDSGMLTPMGLTGMFWLLADSLVKEKQETPDTLELIFNKAIKYIQENISSLTTVDSVAKNVGISRSYLTRIFNKFVTQSPKQYILRCHINEAKSLLTGTDMTIGEIASAVGYESQSDFSKAFARICLMSPSEYRKQRTIKP